MNTGGHHWLAEQAGLPELVAAMEGLGRQRVSLNAFLLGNWITDVHQLVDPVASTPAKFDAALTSVMAGVRSSILIEVDGKHGKSWKHVFNTAIGEALDDFEARVKAAIDAFFETSSTGSTKGFDAIKTMFRIAGYFRFAAPMEPPSINPWEPAAGPRIDVNAYFRVFAEMFEQYWPHQHMDRPEILPPTDPASYRSEIANGTVANQASISPDLYRYLREDIEIAAGALFEVDREWAQPMFDAGQPFDPSSEGWNLWLAKFGQAVHAVDDFFAHTNFVEHAVKLLGKNAIPKGAEREVFARRLQRLGTTKKNGQPAEETEVVSGYFDTTDMFFSLVHNLEEVFGVHYRDPLAKADDAYDTFRRKYGNANRAWFEAQKMINDVSEWISDPDAAAKNPENGLTKKIEAKKFRLHEPPTEDDIRRLLSQFPVFQQTPDRVKHDIVTALVVIHGVTDVGITVYEAYDTMRDFVRFIDGPTDFLIQWLSEKIDAAIRDAVIFYAREWLHIQLGGRRVGSHSLMNHDAEEAVLFDEAMHVAAAVQWYVVTVMTRRLHGIETATQKGWSIDWLELLEHFLRHPKAVPGRRTEMLTVCVPIEHVVDNVKTVDSLATLAKRYAPTACHKRFTWRTIADALYDTDGLTDGATRMIVNRAIAAQGSGYKVKDDINYAWNPGTRLLIPDQQFEVPLSVAEPTDSLWWREVLTAKDWTKVRGGPDPDSRMSTPGVEIDHAVQRLTPDAVEARIAAATRLWRARRDAYKL